MHSFVLQDWITIRGASNTNVTQGESDWLDLAPYQDVSFWLDLREVTSTPSIVFETSPIKEDVIFLASPMVSAIALSGFSASSNPQRVPITTSQTPVARYVRWRLIAPAALWDATFRVLVSCDGLGL